MAAAASLPWFWEDAIIGSGAAGPARSLSTGNCLEQQTRLACRQTGRDAVVGWLSRLIGPKRARADKSAGSSTWMQERPKRSGVLRNTAASNAQADAGNAGSSNWGSCGTPRARARAQAQAPARSGPEFRALGRLVGSWRGADWISRSFTQMAQIRLGRGSQCGCDNMAMQGSWRNGWPSVGVRSGLWTLSRVASVEIEMRCPGRGCCS
ncbi:hypothetical protein N657DRAFT_645227 [Parathielavia appendiculata]|uniref:Uncharacterized protein n=1 Tax=Parathielavia appendiculata TaxID=2587402 RepID=A0AAN6TZY0_9PEZI|nr:hypothetical protein N657DRAFT_645227 [Parathielavia appendiculata]